MAIGTMEILTAALFLVPLSLMDKQWIPKWSIRVPLLLTTAAVIFRIIAFWSGDSSDAHVVGYLPADSTGLSRILHVFDGPNGLMLGLLWGYTIGIATSRPNRNSRRWYTLCWITLLLFGVDSAAFSNIGSSGLTNAPSVLDANSLIYPFLGFTISAIVIPTYVEFDSSSNLRIIAAISCTILLFDVSSEPIAWVFICLFIHQLSSKRIHKLRGVATKNRWLGLLVVFYSSIIFLTIAVFWIISQDNSELFWSSRYALGWIFLCGCVGSLMPLVGFDSKPRPEVWGFLTGIILAPALLPNTHLMETTLLPILLLSISMPIIATLPEYRRNMTQKQRLLEWFSLTILVLIVMSLYQYIDLSLIAIILFTPFFIRTAISDDEEE